MERLLAIGISNALAAGALALVALAVARLLRRPAVTHALWLLVLLKLLTPPIVVVPIFPARDEQPPLAAPAHAAEHDLPPLEKPWPEYDFLVTPAQPLVPLEEPPPRLEPLLESIDGSPRRLETPAPSALGLPEHPMAAHHMPFNAASAETQPAPSTSMRPPNRRLDDRTWMRITCALWAGGSLLWCAVALVRIARFHRLLRYAKPAAQEIQQAARDTAARLGLRGYPTIEVVPGRLPPLVWFVGRRPRLLLAARLMEQLDAQQTAALIAHELAHLRRRDHWMRLVELAATALYWWNPVLWWARRELREAEEQCCDAWAVWALRGPPRAYAETLLETVDLLSQTPRSLPPLASGLAHERTLRRRLTMIMQNRTTRRLSWAARCALLTLAAALLPLVPGRAQNEAPLSGQTRADTRPSAIDREEPSRPAEVADPALEPTEAAVTASAEQNTPPSPEISAALEQLRALEETAKYTENLYRRGFATKAQLEADQRAVERAKQQLQAQRRAAHERAKTDVIQAQSDLEIANISRREAVEGTFPQEENRHQANVLVAQENLFRAQEKLENTKNLQEKGFATKQHVEASQFALERAQLELENAKTARKVTLEFTHPKILTELEAKIEQAEAKLARAKQQLKQAQDAQLKPVELRSEQQDPVARVNGQAISYEELARACVARHGATVLGQLINLRIIEQACADRGISISAAELDAEVDAHAKRAGFTTREALFKTYADVRGLNPETVIRDSIRSNLALRRLAESNIDVTDQEIEQAFEAKFGERVKARMIVCSDKSRALEAWEKAKRAIDAGRPEEFTQLVRQYSTDPASRQLGGRIQPISRLSKMPALEEAAFRLGDGELSPVIEIRGDHYIVLLCEGRTDPVDVRIDEVRDRLRDDVRRNKADRAKADILAELKEAATIESFIGGETPGDSGDEAKLRRAAKLREQIEQLERQLRLLESGQGGGAVQP